MILLQLSAGQGPAECSLAVTRAIQVLAKEADELRVSLVLLEQCEGSYKNTFKSVLYKLEGELSRTLAERWNGTMQWICQSPYRVRHKRKNWFFTGSYSEHSPTSSSTAIRFEACRSSGPGGQHANKTSSAIRAVHLESGITVKVQTERSQHMNKRLAKALIELKLDEQAETNNRQQEKLRHKSHHGIERGNAIRIFKGKEFSDAMV
jgi:peptide chain release factor